MEETLTRDNLLALLEKGIAYHNSDLSWEERNLVENYLQSGEIKIICATTTLAMGVNLPFKNVILSIDKVENVNGNYQDVRVTSLTFSDIENMGGRAGRLNSGKKEEFGRVIFLAHSLLSESIYKNLYFNFLRDRLEKNNTADYIGERWDQGKAAEELIPYPETGDLDSSGAAGVAGAAGPKKKEKDLTTLLLRLMVNGKDSIDAILDSIHEGSLVGTGVEAGASKVSCLEEGNRGYWRFVIDKKRSREKMGNALIQLKENHLITEDDKGVFSVTDAGTLIISRGIKVDTYLYFLSWLAGSIKREISPLEIIFTLALSEDGKALSIPYPQFYRRGYKKGKYHYTDWQEVYRNKLLSLVFDLGEEGKKIYQGEHGLQKGKTGIEDYLAFKKTLLLYDWIGNREIRSIEQEYSLYRGAVKRLGEGFSWLADSLAAVTEHAGWKKEREEDLKKIRNLSERLGEGVEEEGLSLARLHIPGLTRSYIERLVKEGYEDEDCLEELGEKELGDILPGRLVKRIKERIKEEKEEEIRKEGKNGGGGRGGEEERGLEGQEAGRQGQGAKQEKEKRVEEKEAKVNDEMEMIAPVLVIDQHRPDRIIFEGKEVKVTTIGFSLLYLLAQHRGQVVSYEEILRNLWKNDEDAIYTRINYHICKIRKDISKAVNNESRQVKKIQNIFKTVPGRGLMLNIDKKELWIR
jgi:helicase